MTAAVTELGCFTGVSFLVPSHVSSCSVGNPVSLAAFIAYAEEAITLVQIKTTTNRRLPAALQLPSWLC